MCANIKKLVNFSGQPIIKSMDESEEKNSTCRSSITCPIIYIHKGYDFTRSPPHIKCIIMKYSKHFLVHA